MTPQLERGQEDRSRQLPVIEARFPARWWSGSPNSLMAATAVIVHLGPLRRISGNNIHVFNRASNPENRCSVRLFLTAVANAFRWPMSTTSFLPRVIPV